jgi:hypothetical protein
LHGGNNPIGAANGRWRDGRYSRYIPKTLQADYRRATQDPRLLELTGELGLLQARIAALLRDMSEAQPPPWHASVESLNDLCQAVRDDEGVADALARHAQVVRTGADAARNHDRLWHELYKAIDLKGRTARLEWKRQLDLHTTMTAEQVMILVSGLLSAVEDVCLDVRGDRDLYRRIVGRAITYLPPEARESVGEIIDNRPAR